MVNSTSVGLFGKEHSNIHVPGTAMKKHINNHQHTSTTGWSFPSLYRTLSPWLVHSVFPRLPHLAGQRRFVLGMDADGILPELRGQSPTSVQSDVKGPNLVFDLLSRIGFVMFCMTISSKMRSLTCR